MAMQFSTPLDFEHDVVGIMDRSGYIRFISPAAASYRQARKPEEVIGHHFHDFVHPEDVHHFDKWLNAEFLKAGASVSHVLFRVRGPDGAWRWIEATRPGLEGHHVRAHIIFFLRDIAAHCLVEHQYRMAEQIAGYGVWNIRNDSPYAYHSAGMVRLFGFEPGDPATAAKFWPLQQVERQDAPRILRILRRALEAPQAFSFVCAVRTRDGSRRILKTKGHVESNAAGIDTIFAVSQDITAVHTAEAQLRASEEQYRLLTQRASDIICQLTSEGIIEFISPSVLRLTGRRPSRLTGLQFTTLLPETEHDEFRKFLTRLLQGDESALCTVRFNGIDRREAWLEISGRTVKDHADVVCVARDISERKEFQLELEKARQHAESVSASKSRFLANLSHELRTPLNAILGFSELIQARKPAGEHDGRSAEYAALIHESGTILASLINDLLDLSKIEAGKFELNPEQIGLEEIVPVSLQQVEPDLKKKKISVENRIPDHGLSLVADRRALIQILINLLANAVNFTPEGGRIELSARTNGGQLEFSVCDNGIGISKEDLERITAPFEQAAGDAALSRKGTGLGLALVKSLVELHGGKLTIESELGKGTCVTVRLPREWPRKAA